MKKKQLTNISKLEILTEIVKERKDIYDRILDCKNNNSASDTEVSLAKIDWLEAQLRLIDSK